MLCVPVGLYHRWTETASVFGIGGIGSPFMLPTGKKFSDDFHIFTVEWQPNQLRFCVDNRLHQTLTPANLPAGKTWTNLPGY